MAVSYRTKTAKLKRRLFLDAVTDARMEADKATGVLIAARDHVVSAAQDSPDCPDLIRQACNDLAEADSADKTASMAWWEATMRADQQNLSYWKSLSISAIEAVIWGAVLISVTFGIVMLLINN